MARRLPQHRRTPCVVQLDEGVSSPAREPIEEAPQGGRIRLGRYADHSYHERSTVPPSSRSHRVRETPLHLHVSPSARGAGGWRNRDAPPRCSGRCWPATDGLRPSQSLGGSMTSTSSPRWARQQLNPVLPCRDSAHTAGRSVAHWSGVSLASGASSVPDAVQIARRRGHIGATE